VIELLYTVVLVLGMVACSLVLGAFAVLFGLGALAWVAGVYERMRGRI